MEGGHLKKAFIHFYERFRFPFFVAMGSGLLAYVYFFTNKLPNYDDVFFTFSKGYGLASGRWGLELCELIFPNYSMPWLWGIISIVLLSISACLVLDVLEIRNRTLGCLAAALIVVFPSEIGTFTYMFTSSSYALSFLFAVLSVHLVRKGDEWWRYAVSGGLIILMLSIYQAYIAITASLFVLLMIADTLRTEKSVKHIIARGIQYLILMAFSVAAYLLITKVLQNLRAEQYGEYAQDAFGNPQSFTERIYTCYRSFLAVFVPNYRMYGLVVSKFEAYLHVAAILISAVSILLVYWKSKKWGRFAFLAALTAVVLPLAMTCMLFVAGNVIVHTLVMYGFSLIYAYFALAVDYGTEIGAFRNKGLQSCLCLALFTILCCNVTESNRAALAMQFEYENTTPCIRQLLPRFKAHRDLTKILKLRW